MTSYLPTIKLAMYFISSVKSLSCHAHEIDKITDIGTMFNFSKTVPVGEPRASVYW